MTLDAVLVAGALRRGGAATLDALAARLDGPDRESLLWAIDDARARGWLEGGDDPDCGPDGLCGASAPAVYRLTAAGRAATVRLLSGPADTTWLAEFP